MRLKKWCFIPFLFAAVCLTGCNPLLTARVKLPWMTDFEAAKAKAQQEKKLLLINFTGSDWCGWCKRLRAEVFAKPVFADYAKANLILLEVDFPRNKAQRPEQMQANQALSQQFKVQGFPTVFLLDSQGRTLGSTGYLPGGPENFVKELKRLANTRSKPSEDSDEPDLRLTGISGAVGSRLAMINNATLAAGESASVKTSQGRIQIRCIAILDHSVVVSVDGKSDPIELHLSGRL